MNIQTGLDNIKTLSNEDYWEKQRQEELESAKKKEVHLYKWVDYLKSKGLKFTFWFDKSAPYEDEVNILFDEHKCYPQCFNLRFEKGELRAWDSHFGGGTSMVFNEPEEKVVDEIISRAKNKECEESSWNENTEQEWIDETKRKIQENNWINRD